VTLRNVFSSTSLTQKGVVLVSNSDVFKMKDKLLLERRKLLGDSSIDPLLDDIDKLVEWGEDNMPPFRTIPFNTINRESMKLALSGTINPGDTVEKLQYKTKTLCCHNKGVLELVAILKNPQNYPVNITFKRDNGDNNTDSMTNINEIEVQGAGTPGANGTYKRDIDRRGYPSFVKRGRWQGGNEKFIIYRDYGHWKIGLPSIGKNLYVEWARGNTELPPKTNWEVCGLSGEEPAPTLQY